MINDRYKIIRKVGEGRSSVYLCRDTLRAGAGIAIKVLPPDVGEEEKRSFRDEYFLLKKLNHPNIISVFEYEVIVSFDEEDDRFKIRNGSAFFTLEFFEGQELFDYKDLQEEPVLRNIICQISSVLYYIHQSSYVYYDLKSENILISKINGRPVVKFIDFGLTKRLSETGGISARGTAEYIAPEILRNENIDHRIDLYSFGILLYRIIYGRFPFHKNDQLGIYKAHLEEQFEFPGSLFNDKLIGIVKKLLSKEAFGRFYTTIGIINEVNPPRLKEYKNDWTRIPTFCARKDSLSIISSYIEKVNDGEVLSIKGAEGAGKSTLLREVNYRYPFSILISSEQNTDYNIWQMLLRGILYHQDIYTKLSPGTLAKAGRILNGVSINLVEDLKSVIIKLISAGKFILLIDNFNLFSNFDLEIFLQLIPVLQVNRIKTIITEDSSNEYKSSAINNLQVVNLNPFTEIQVAEFVDESFADFYLKEKIKKAIILYSDLLPGSIELFLRDLLVLNILEFADNGPVLEIDENLDKILRGSQEDIYRFRWNNLDVGSRDLAFFLSLFNTNPDVNTICQLTNQSKEQVIASLIRLSEANILHFNTVLETLQFTSRGIKEYVYSTKEDLKTAHSEIADLLSRKIPHFNRNEIARHMELAGRYEETYSILKEEINKARNASALSYERSILEHLQQLPLKHDSLRELKIALCNCLFSVGEINACIELADELLEGTRSTEEETELKILKGKALISVQSIKAGKELLESTLNKIERPERKNEMLAEIAEAEYEMAKYEEAENLADRLIADESTAAETRGKIYRLKGLIELFKNNNPNGTIRYLELALKEYEKNNQLARVATMENNLGNIFNIVLNREKAEYHWKRSISLNESIGNLLQNGINLISNGIYNYENSNFEKAVEQYLSANSIFQALGDRNNTGINYINLGEVYFIICEYEKAVKILQTASEIFDGLGNKVEKAEAKFLLGKLFFEIGDSESLKVLLQSYTEFNELNLDKPDFNYKYLGVLYKIMGDKSQGIIDELYVLREKCVVFSDNLIYCEIQVKVIEYLLAADRYQDAFKELISEDFVNICSTNVYYNSYRNFLMGKILEVERIKGYEPFLTYYERAYNQVGTISITELTWKILFALFRVYKDRGNISRVTEYGKYAKETLFYIADQINSVILKKLYLEKPERKNVLIKLEQK